MDGGHDRVRGGGSSGVAIAAACLHRLGPAMVVECDGGAGSTCHRRIGAWHRGRVAVIISVTADVVADGRLGDRGRAQHHVLQPHQPSRGPLDDRHVGGGSKLTALVEPIVVEQVLRIRIDRDAAHW